MPQPEKAALIPIEIIPHPKGLCSANREWPWENLQKIQVFIKLIKLRLVSNSQSVLPFDVEVNLFIPLDPWILTVPSLCQQNPSGKSEDFQQTIQHHTIDQKKTQNTILSSSNQKKTTGEEIWVKYQGWNMMVLIFGSVSFFVFV